MAQPGGRTVQGAYEGLRDELLCGLSRLKDVDVVLLALHGAMVAERCDDCEGDILQRARTIVGPAVTIGAMLDLHCHLTDKMLQHADFLLTYKEYPHTDVLESAQILFEQCRAAAAGQTRPVMAITRCHRRGLWRTTTPAMRRFVAYLRSLEDDGALSVSLVHGFPWGDVAQAGAAVVAITDGDQPAAQALADSVSERFLEFCGAEEADAYCSLEKALSLAASSGNGPIVLADVSDNPGCGAPGDSTHILRAVIDAGIRDAVFLCLWDPLAVATCQDAGEGAELLLRIGGKSGPASGAPVDMTVLVERVARGLSQSLAGESFPLGDCALVSAAGLRILLTADRVQTTGLECLTSVGREPKNERIIVVKSAQHFVAEYGSIATQIHYVAAQGASCPDYSALRYLRAGTATAAPSSDNNL
jgi:microcystin degradation protein MlrC